MNKRRAAALIVASATVPIVGSPLFAPSPAMAVPTLLITNQGPATDNSGHTTTGWTGYLLTLKATSGGLIAAVDLGLNASSTKGIFGTLLQDWLPSKSGPLPTPLGHTSTDSNGSDDGTDSHWLIVGGVVGAPTIEDNDQVQPAGAPTDDSGNIWGTGTYIHGEVGILGASQVNSQPLAYIVIKDGTAAHVSIDVAERDAVSIVHIDATVPEPVSGSLIIGAGVIGLLGRRPKRNAA